MFLSKFTRHRDRNALRAFHHPMSDKWTKSQFANKYWCEECRIFVQNNNISRANHEATWKHKNNIKRKLNQAHRDAAASKRQEQLLQSELEAMERLEKGLKGPSVMAHEKAQSDRARKELVFGRPPTTTTAPTTTATSSTNHPSYPPMLISDNRPFVAPRPDEGVRTAADLMTPLIPAETVSDQPVTTAAPLGSWVRVSAKIVPVSSSEKDDLNEKSDVTENGNVRKRPVEEEEDEDEQTTEGVGTERTWKLQEKSYPSATSASNAETTNVLLQDATSDNAPVPAAPVAFIKKRSNQANKQRKIRPTGQL